MGAAMRDRRRGQNDGKPPCSEAELEPLLAGAWARGLYDALEMTSQAAVLLDHEGRALALTTAARGFVGPRFAIAGGRPVLASPDDSRRLAAAILDAIAGRETRLTVGSSLEPMVVNVRPTPAAPAQLLSAILMIQNDELSYSAAGRRRASALTAAAPAH